LVDSCIGCLQSRGLPAQRACQREQKVGKGGGLCLNPMRVRNRVTIKYPISIGCGTNGGCGWKALFD